MTRPRARATAAVRALALVAVALLACAAHAADVDIALVRMGVGNHFRPGDQTAILVRVTSALAEPVQARVEWELRNADGDIARYGREVALAPGAPAERWVYGIMPIVSSSALGSAELVSVVRVLQVEDGRTTRVLGERRIEASVAEQAPMPVESTEALIGVVGDGRAGLSGLSTPTPKASFCASMNELTKVARGIDAAGLPDRWEGLASFESIIWTNAPVQNLAPDQARALLDWTRRGGNLVIVLPESGDPWGVGGGRSRTALADAIPAKATRHDGVPVADLLPVLSRTRELRNASARVAIWTFATAPNDAWQPLVVLPCRVDPRTGNLLPREGSLDGQAVAVRRTLGFGHVTVVGIDVDGLDRRALSADGIPQSDVFWNRILGRRADTPSQADWNALAAAQRLDLRDTVEIPSNGGNTVNQLIGLPTAAAVGVLGLMAAFAAYWALAGPVGFFVLRSMRRTQYAWLAFVAVAGAATLVAWAVTGLSELTTARVQHLTVIDRIDGFGVPAEERGTIRASSWLSAALPGYGGARVALASAKGAPGADQLWSWFPPPAGNSAGFPDVEAYEVPNATPAAYELPSRATSTVLAARWQGRPAAEWDALPTVMRERPLRQDVEWNGREPTVILRGAIQHGLRIPLTDVTLVHVGPFRPAPRRSEGNPPLIRPSGGMPSLARMAHVDAWPPGTPLDVAAALYEGQDAGTPGAPTPAPARDAGPLSAQQTLVRLFRDPIRETSVVGYFDPSRVFGDEAQVQMKMWYSMLPPPEYVVPKDMTGNPSRAGAARLDRDFGRELDLGTRFASPCLIVVGRASTGASSGVPLPFPMTIDGDVPEAAGTTWVRVVFPLPNVPGAMADAP